MATNPGTIAAFVELCYLATWHSTMYLFFNYFIDTHCIVGKSLVFRKANLDKLGGFKKYSNYLAEDLFVAKDFWKAKWPSKIAPDPSIQNLGNITLSEYWMRQERWTRLRFSAQPGPTFLEVFTHIFINGMLSYHAMSTILGIPPSQYLWIHFAIWLFTDTLQFCLFHGFNPVTLVKFLGAWALRELLALPLLLVAAQGDTVLWRGKYYKIAEASLLTNTKRD